MTTSPDGESVPVCICRACAGRDPVAAEAGFRARLAELGAELLEPYRNSGTPHHVRCAAGTATALRYVTETVALLAARSAKLRQSLALAQEAGHACLVIDGALIPIDRVVADRPFYSGKYRKHGMNLQVIATPDGDIVWVSGPLPGAVHDLTAARIWGIVRELASCGLVILADKGYAGAGEHIRTPYRGRNKPASQNDANRAHARLRSPGERANARLKTWRILRKLRCCPW